MDRTAVAAEASARFTSRQVFLRNEINGAASYVRLSEYGKTHWLPTDVYGGVHENPQRSSAVHIGWEPAG